MAIRQALNKLLDLDLAIIEDAYQAEYAARLQRSERLAAIGQVAGGVAHELRNPLNVVKTSVYYLLNARNPTPEKKAEHLQRIERHVVAGRRRHHGPVELRQDAAAQPRPVPGGPVPARSAGGQRRCPTRCAVEVDCPAELPPVLGDADQLRIVFGNLIRNAREAMPQGGDLTSRGRPDGDGVEVEVSRHRRRHRHGEPQPDHGAALLDQGPRAGPGAGHRPGHPG